MTREQRRDLIEVAGAIAIVVSLVFVAIEVRQNTTAMTASAYQGRSEALQDLAVVVATSEVLARIEANYQKPLATCAPLDNYCYEIDHE